MAVEKFFGYVEDLQERREYQRTHGTLGQINSQLIGGSPNEDIYLWKPLLQFMPNFAASKQGIGDCYAPDTLVPGETLKKIKDVQVGDMVFAGDGSLTRVITTETKVTNQPMVTIEVLGGLPLKVTTDHKVLVYRMGWQGGKRINRALYERKSQGKKLDGSPAGGVVVTKYEARKAELIPAGELNDGDYLLTPLDLQLPTEIPDHPLLATSEGRWAFGYLLGNGHVAATGRTADWAFPKKEIGERLIAVLTELGFTPKVSMAGQSLKCWRVVIHSVEFCRPLREMIYDADKLKLMPLWAIRDKDVIDGLLQADGFIRNNCQYFDSVSPSLAFGVFMALLLRGDDPTIGKFHRGVGSFKTDKPAYRVRAVNNSQKKMIWRDETYLCRPITKTSLHEGPHVVCDIGVEHPSHTFLPNICVLSNCVSHGLAHAILLSVGVASAQGLMNFPGAYFATEVIYGGSRVEAAGKKYDGGGDGAIPELGIRWLEKFGAVLRQDFSQLTGNPIHDYRVYSAQKAKEHGMYGAGGQKDMGKMDQIATQHPVQASTAITTLDEFVGAISNGYAIAIGASSGYGDMRRNADGVCRWVDTWQHEQAYGGLRHFKGRIQGRKFQSWGACVTGPDPGIEDPNISNCSWWVDEPDLLKEIKSGSLNAICSVGNFERRNISSILAINSRLDA